MRNKIFCGLFSLFPYQGEYDFKTVKVYNNTNEIFNIQNAVKNYSCLVKQKKKSIALDESFEFSYAIHNFVYDSNSNVLYPDGDEDNRLFKDISDLDGIIFDLDGSKIKLAWRYTKNQTNRPYPFQLNPITTSYLMVFDERRLPEYVFYIKPMISALKFDSKQINPQLQ